jgi:phosphoribosylformimino-5-aminoimidazole carboxamide ribotide isomerase
MEVIPVIDLKGGAVVRARGGRRDAYAPLQSRLSATSAPRDVVLGLLAFHRFRTIYAADLDAIEKVGDHEDTLRALCAAFPQVNFWVDAGLADAAGARAWLARHKRATLVLGSETLADAAALADLKGEPRLVLSLDFEGDRFLGPPLLLATRALWPARAIVMSLASVGAGAGPDFARLAALRRAGDTALYAAGGVRGPGDLADLARSGAAGALVASALHDGQLSEANLAAAAENEVEKA